MVGKMMTILTVFLLLITLMTVEHVEGENITNVDIYLLDHSPNLIDGKARMLTGVLNVINVSISGTYNWASVEIYPSKGLPETKNMTNYYLWNYSNDNFVCIYDGYIDIERSITSQDWIEFVVGVSAFVELGLWNLTVRTDTDKLSIQFNLDLPEAGIGSSAPDFYFSTSPFSGEDYNSSDDRMYFRTTNTGNIPLKMKINYDSFNEYIHTTNTTGIFDIGEERYHYLSFNTPVWGPRKVEIKGSITGEPFYVITPDMVRLIPVPQLTFKITLEIVRPGFKLLDMGDVIIQYKQTASVTYDETIDLEVYLTGEETTTIISSTEQLSLESTLYKGTKREGEIKINLSNDTEEALTYTVKGTHANAVGELIYTIRWGDNEEVVVTEVTTGPAPEENTDDEQERNTFGFLFVLAVICIAALFVILANRKKGVETEREKKRREWLERHKGRKI